MCFDTTAMPKEPAFEANTSGHILIAASAAMVLLFSTSIFSPLLHVIFNEVRAQSIDTGSIKEKIQDLNKDAQIFTKKLKEVKGGKGTKLLRGSSQGW